MIIRTARPADAPAIAAIYAPIVESTTISFELEAPTVDEMRRRIESTLEHLPWLVAVDGSDAVQGYAYAGRHRERAAYQWSVDVTAYVHEALRGQGIGKALYGRLFEELVALGYCQAFAGIALPNAASIGLHESVGFEPLGVYRRVGYKRGTWHDVGWWQKSLQAVEHPAPPRRFTAIG
jgi:L-amino acid N-acyltransferase YncA